MIFDNEWYLLRNFRIELLSDTDARQKHIWKNSDTIMLLSLLLYNL
jgi:hypothetical protein